MPLTTQKPLFNPGRNCWRVERADAARVLVDYGHYYRALHAAIVAAKHSIFITGWDIDSRIALLRGEDAKNATAPVTFRDLIFWKARQNPDIQIYLNKWDYSIFFAKEREVFANFKWRRHRPRNVHYTLDCMLPAAACHHQKIAVIDDALAFSGGMDIALNRWDFREHHVNDPNRVDPGGMNHPFSHIHYAPYHDIMIMLSGPAARALGEWTRIRWRTATGQEPIPLAPLPTDASTLWPALYAPQFTSLDVAIARTMPSINEQYPVIEIEKILIDAIERAESFIYIENQFLTYLPLADALNRRLRERPNLRILAISCDKPKGRMEKKSMWSGRVMFRDAVERGGVADRFLLCHPISREHGHEDPVRIHSKLTIIDDRSIQVGSANLNNRSMAFDSELDITIDAHDDATRTRIAAIRDDLIREHTGFELDRIRHIIDSGAPVAEFASYLPTSRQHLKKIDDEIYRREPGQAFARAVADPVAPIIPGWLTVPKRFFAAGGLHKRTAWRIIALVAAIAAMVLMWRFTPLAHYASPKVVIPVIQRWSHTPWIVPIMLGLYTVAELLFFPVMVLDASTVTAFGLPLGPPLALAGALTSAAAGFWLGRWMGPEKMKKLLGRSGDKVQSEMRHMGIIGIATLRLVPIAPFTAVNFAVGLSAVPFLTFLFGTALGMLPGITVLTILRGSLARLYHHPDAKGIALLILGIAVWGGLVYLSHMLAKRMQSARKV